MQRVTVAVLEPGEGPAREFLADKITVELNDGHLVIFTKINDGKRSTQFFAPGQWLVCSWEDEFDEGSPETVPDHS